LYGGQAVRRSGRFITWPADADWQPPLSHRHRVICRGSAAPRRAV